MKRADRDEHLNFPRELLVQKITMADKIPYLSSERSRCKRLGVVQGRDSRLRFVRCCSPQFFAALQLTARAPPTKVWLYLGDMLICVSFIRWGYERHLSHASTNGSFTMSSLLEAEGQLLVWQCIDPYLLLLIMDECSFGCFRNTTCHSKIWKGCLQSL